MYIYIYLLYKQIVIRLLPSLKLTISPLKMEYIGILSRFPSQMAYFQRRFVSFREGSFFESWGVEILQYGCFQK